MRRINQKKSMSNDVSAASISDGPRFLSVDPALPASLDLSVNQLRIGGKENYFHCKKCGSCYAIGLRNKHSCVENSMRNHCPICYEVCCQGCKAFVHAGCDKKLSKIKDIRNISYSCPNCRKWKSKIAV